MRTLVLLASLVLLANSGFAQVNDRDTKVRNDRKTFESSKEWIYNDIDAGIRQAKVSGKPLLIVFRCIPCEACHDFDDDVAGRDPVVRDLMDQFVCVRQVYGNNIDLNRFQYDFDLSFSAILMNADGTIYGRFGTRSARKETEDISLEGLRNALGAALKMHREIDRYRPMLAGKQAKPGAYATPRDYPVLKGRYQANLDYEGQVARSCIHCHQIREAERHVYRDAGKSMPDAVLFPYPDPSVLGLSMNPKAAATIKKVEANSLASRAGLREGDEIVKLNGQPLISIADLQWVLHNAPAQGTLKAEIRRDDRTSEATIELPENWRRMGNLSWRPTSWDLRRMALGGMKVDPLPADQREKLGLKADDLALLVKHVGQYGDHAYAKRAGLIAGDVLIGFDDLIGPQTETNLITYALDRQPGHEVKITVLRKGEKKQMKVKVQ